MFKKSRLIILACAIFVVVAAACLALSLYRERTTIESVAVLPDSPVYFVSARGHDGRYFESTHARLCDVSRGALKPIIADDAKWDLEGLNVTMRLDPKAKYADGTSIVASDIVATVRAIKDPQTRSGPYKAKYHNVLEIVALNAHDVRWTFYEATGSELADACDLWVLPASYLERAAAHLQAPWNEVAPGLPPATGPLQARGAWRAGALELVDNPYVSPVLQQTLAKADLAGIATSNEHAARLLFWNGKSQWGADASVRRAVSLVVSREPWRSTRDGMKPAHGLMVESALPNGDLKANARETLIAAGWRRKPELGTWTRNIDDSLRLRVLVSAELSQAATGAIEAFERDLESFGIDVTVDVQPWSQWNYALSKGAYDAYIATLHLKGDPVLAIRDVLQSGQGVRSVLNTYSNFDSELIDLLSSVSEGELQDPSQKAVASLDSNARAKLEQKLQALAPLTVLARTY